jgi:hypothetical protein
MGFYQTTINEAKALIAESEAYEAKPTKASSKRLRAHINNIQKSAVAAKKELIEKDKEV